MLTSEDSCDYAAIYGLGGAGKTQVALEFAYRKRESSPNYSIFWVPAINATSFIKEYREIGRKFHIPRIEEKDANVIELVKETLSAESSGKWLLVIDNADIFNVLDEKADEDSEAPPLLDCLPDSKNGSIIFTTRNYEAAYDLAIENTIKVNEMNKVDAKDLLSKWVVPPSLLGKAEEAEELLELLTHLPLAIIQAAAYMSRKRKTTSQYLEFYRASDQEAIELLSEKVRDKAGSKKIETPVARTWRISFDQIHRENDLAAQYLSSMACLFYENIPRALLPASSSNRKMSDAISTLMAYSFVSERGPDGPYDIHRLVHLATRQWLQETDSLIMWSGKMISLLSDVFPTGQYENRAIWTEYLPHATHLLALSGPSGGDKTALVELLGKVGWCLESDGQYTAALDISQRELNLRTEVFGEKDPDTLTTISNLGSIFFRLGKYSEAEKLYRQAVLLRENLPGSQDKDKLASLSLLALALANQDKQREAEDINRRVLGLRIDVLGLEHPDTLTSRSRVATDLSRRGKYTEAEQMHRQVLESRKKVLSPEHPDTLTSMSHLASVLKSLEKYNEAEKIYQQTLKLDQKILGPKHPNTLTSMNLLASVLHSQGKDLEAEWIHRETLELRKTELPPKHHHTFLSMNNLALVLSSLGKYNEAQEMQEQAVDGFKEVLSKNHPNILSGMANLACIYLKQEKLGGTEKLVGELIEALREVMGEAKTNMGEIQQETLESINKLVSIYIEQGRLEEAEHLGSEMLRMTRHELGDDHRHTLTSKTNLASTFQKQERLKEAEELKEPKETAKKRSRDGSQAEAMDDARKRVKKET
jgi:tetratricopeptide (TPR) repeat protein